MVTHRKEINIYLAIRDGVYKSMFLSYATRLFPLQLMFQWYKLYICNENGGFSLTLTQDSEAESGNFVILYNGFTNDNPNSATLIAPPGSIVFIVAILSHTIISARNT